MSAVPDAQDGGIDNLEALAGAARYNRFLVESALRARACAASGLDIGGRLGVLAAAWARRRSSSSGRVRAAGCRSFRDID